MNCKIAISHLVILLIGLIPSHAQEFVNHTHIDHNSVHLGQLESRFLEWSKGKDLSKVKGWKWYHRWLEEQIRHSNAQGDLPDQAPLFIAARDMLEKKDKLSAISRNANWMPVGPTALPEVPGNDMFWGMGRINTITFHPTDKDTFWVGVAQGGIWKTTNSGESWMPLTDDLPILRISDIAVDPSDPDIMYISVGDYAYLGFALETNERKRNTHYGLGVYKSTDGGMTWDPTGLTFDQQAKDASLTRRVFINPDNTDELVAAGIHGVWRSHDAGNNWERVFNHMVSDFERDPASPNILYMSTAYVAALESGYASIWKSEDFGDTWTELNTTIPSSQSVQRIELSVSPANTQIVYALASGLDGGLYGFYKSEDSGETWDLKMNDLNILHWNDHQQSGGQGNYDLALLADPYDPDKVFAGGVNMWGSEDGGVTWKGATYWLPNYGESIHADHHFYAYNPLDQKYYACHDGGVSRTDKIELVEWDKIVRTPGLTWPTVWEDISGGMQITSFYRLGINPNNESLIIAGAQDNSTFIKTGDTWLNRVLGDGMESILHPSDASVMYASSQFGSLFRSDNGGYDFSSNLAANIRQQETGAWTTPVTLHPNDPNTIITAYGNIWVSNDRGVTWSKKSDIDPIPGSSFIIPTSTMTVAPSDPNTIYIGKRIYPTFNTPGEFWKTSNGGSIVENISNGLPTSLYFTSSTVSSRNSEIVWVTTGGFSDGQKVYRSNGGGNGWNNVSKNLPNIPVNVIKFQPYSTNNTVYIGTDLGVFYTNDDLDEWELYSTNLPNVIVTDLELDPLNNKIYASTFGRGIWVSDLAEVFDMTVGVDPLKALDFQLFPNPNDGSFNIHLNETNSHDVVLEIVDINGRTLMHEQIQTLENKITKSFDLNLNYGMYFARISVGKFGRVVKFAVH